MKLIKQNDNAGGLIFKQNTNGKAMKQNYNFGSGFRSKNSMTGDITLNSSDIIGKSISILFRYKLTSTSYASQMILYTGSYSTQSVSFMAETPSTSFVKYLDGVKSSSTPLGSRLKLNTNTHYCVTLSPSDIPNFTGDVMLRLHTGYHHLYFSGDRLISYETRDSTLQHLAVYNRELSQKEISYYYNNSLGNELLNTSGLLSEIRVNTGLILGDDIILPDISGNGSNMVIVGLPAGTISERLDYFNTIALELYKP